MTAHAIPAHEAVTVLYLSEMAGTWWPPMALNCWRCGGLLRVTPPSGADPGYLTDIQCGREVAEVWEVRRVRFAPSPDDYGPRKPGRPPGRRTGAKKTTDPCVGGCGRSVERSNSKSGLCFACSMAARKARGWRK